MQKSYRYIYLLKYHNHSLYISYNFYDQHSLDTGKQSTAVYAHDTLSITQITFSLKCNFLKHYTNLFRNSKFQWKIIIDWNDSRVIFCTTRQSLTHTHFTK